jgi:hypothetical protein
VPLAIAAKNLDVMSSHTHCSQLTAPVLGTVCSSAEGKKTETYLNAFLGCFKALCDVNSACGFNLYLDKISRRIQVGKTPNNCAALGNEIAEAYKGAWNIGKGNSCMWEAAQMTGTNEINNPWGTLPNRCHKMMKCCDTLHSGDAENKRCKSEMCYTGWPCSKGSAASHPFCGGDLSE